jgi:HAD superfamily hydrolase (TIGR01509 family)
MLLEDAITLPPLARASLARDLEAVEMRGARDATPIPGIFEVLDLVRAAGTPWAIVSRNCRASIFEAARTIGIELPAVVRSRDDGTSVKPDPAALRETCEALGVRTSQSLLVGDYIYDMMGARRAGMRGVLVRDRAEPDWMPWIECCFRSMAELRDEMLRPGEITPWEYRKVESARGRGFLRLAHSLAVSVPAGARPSVIEWLAAAAPLGIGTFVAPDGFLSPDTWMDSPSFDPAFIGRRLSDAIASFLESRYPFSKVVERWEIDGAVSMPEDSSEIEGILSDMAMRGT